MERFGKILYFYILGLFVFFTLYMTVALVLSPKNDPQERGFTPCTKQFVIDVSTCSRGSIGCPLRHLWQDMKCNTVVILDGLGAWIKRKQSTPWENYLYTPTETYQDGDGTSLSSDDMAEIEKLRLIREKTQQELEDAKHRQLNLNENVITSSDDKVYHKENYDLKEPNEPLGDISDESAINLTNEEKDEK